MKDKLNGWLDLVIGEKHEVTQSIHEALNDRVTSPFYGYFTISWILVNWDYIYAALFVGGEEILQSKGLLKNEYLLQQVLPTQYASFLYWWHFLLLPLLITIVALWLMPHVTRVFFRRNIRNKVKNEQIRAEELAAEIKAETRVLEAEVEQAKVEKEAEEISPELNWKRQYEEFKHHRLYKKFDEIIESIYTFSGQISVNDFDGSTQSWITFELSKDILVYSDVNNLVTKSGNIIELTEKGKQFVKWFSNDN